MSAALQTLLCQLNDTWLTSSACMVTFPEMLARDGKLYWQSNRVGYLTWLCEDLAMCGLKRLLG
jgi:hypothetical protein